MRLCARYAFLVALLALQYAVAEAGYQFALQTDELPHVYLSATGINVWDGSCTFASPCSNESEPCLPPTGAPTLVSTTSRTCKITFLGGDYSDFPVALSGGNSGVWLLIDALPLLATSPLESLDISVTNVPELIFGAPLGTPSNRRMFVDNLRFFAANVTSFLVSQLKGKGNQFIMERKIPTSSEDSASSITFHASELEFTKQAKSSDSLVTLVGPPSYIRSRSITVGFDHTDIYLDSEATGLISANFPLNSLGIIASRVITPKFLLNFNATKSLPEFIKSMDVSLTSYSTIENASEIFISDQSVDDFNRSSAFSLLLSVGSSISGIARGAVAPLYKDKCVNINLLGDFAPTRLSGLEINCNHRNSIYTDHHCDFKMDSANTTSIDNRLCLLGTNGNSTATHPPTYQIFGTVEITGRNIFARTEIVDADIETSTQTQFIRSFAFDGPPAPIKAFDSVYSIISPDFYYSGLSRLSAGIETNSIHLIEGNLQLGSSKIAPLAFLRNTYSLDQESSKNASIARIILGSKTSKLSASIVPNQRVSWDFTTPIQIYGSGNENFGHGSVLDTSTVELTMHAQIPPAESSPEVVELPLLQWYNGASMHDKSYADFFRQLSVDWMSLDAKPAKDFWYLIGPVQLSSDSERVSLAPTQLYENSTYVFYGSTSYGHPAQLQFGTMNTPVLAPKSSPSPVENSPEKWRKSKNLGIGIGLGIVALIITIVAAFIVYRTFCVGRKDAAEMERLINH